LFNYFLFSVAQYHSFDLPYVESDAISQLRATRWLPLQTMKSSYPGQLNNPVERLDQLRSEAEEVLEPIDLDGEGEDDEDEEDEDDEAEEGDEDEEEEEDASDDEVPNLVPDGSSAANEEDQTNQGLFQ
jgi:hypothetical protein